MSLTFVSAPLLFRPVAKTRLHVTSLNGRRLRVAPVRRAFPHTACLAVNKESEAQEEEEQLDEVAMRAAEIHEVVNGLKEFKNRIIDGA